MENRIKHDENYTKLHLSVMVKAAINTKWWKFKKYQTQVKMIYRYIDKHKDCCRLGL